MKTPLPKPRKHIAETDLVRPDWLAAEPRREQSLWLDRNENTDPELGRVVRDVLSTLPDKRLYSYPENGPTYRKLAAHLDVDPHQILFSAGSDGAIRAVFEAYVNPGDVVVHPDPTFAMYSLYCRIYGANARTVAYTASQNGPVLDIDAFIDLVQTSAPKLVCLPNPDSPTGTIVAEPDLRRLVEAAGAAGALMLIDEAYYPFYPHTVVPWIADAPHLIVTRSTAKAWGLAGLRIGYAIANNEVAAHLHKVRPMYETSTIAVAVLDGMLDRLDEIDASVQRLEAGKDAFIQAMEPLGFLTLRSHGNFLHVAFGEKADAVHKALGDFVYYRKDGGHSSLAGYSRFSTTTPELFAPLIEIIKNV